MKQFFRILQSFPQFDGTSYIWRGRDRKKYPTSQNVQLRSERYSGGKNRFMTELITIFYVLYGYDSDRSN